jgi:hypothetical protein
MEKQALRFYVPFLPAYILLIVEWIHLFGSRSPDAHRVSVVRALVCVPVLCWAIFAGAQAFNLELLSRLPLGLGETPGLSGTAMFTYAAPLSVALGVMAWTLRQRFVRGTTLLWIVTVMLCAVILRDLSVEARFLLAPSYRAAEIATAIEDLVAEDASVAGDYAPFLASDTRLRTLYTNRTYNVPKHFPRLRPDYFVYSDTTEMRDMPRLIEELDGVSMLPPIYSSSYAERQVVLYPLRYEE